MGWRKYVACDSTKSLITFYRGRFTLGFISDTILEDLTSYDVRHLIMMEDENTQTKVVELETNPRKYFTITEKAPPENFSDSRFKLWKVHRMFFCCPHSLISSNDYFCLMMEK